MRILTTQLESPAQATARSLILGIQGTKRALLGELRHNINILWDNPDPQSVLDALGAEASSLYSLNSAIVTFMQGILTQAGDVEALEELQQITAKVRPSTINPDGTVTIIVDN